jgi:hypothetical protein
VKQIPRKKAELDLISLPVQKAENNIIAFLFDTGATISLVKLEVLKDDTVIREDRIKLTGITGHTITTIGKTYLNVSLTDGRIKHPVYVLKDDTPMEHDGILGIDFIYKSKATCNFDTKRVRIGNSSFKLYPYKRIALQPRSETIVQVIATQNVTGVTRPEETSPGIFIGSCLVQPREFACPVSILNTTEKAMEI